MNGSVFQFFEGNIETLHCAETNQEFEALGMSLNNSRMPLNLKICYSVHVVNIIVPN